jgi:hypothetical protein
MSLASSYCAKLVKWLINEKIKKARIPLIPTAKIIAGQTVYGPKASKIEQHQKTDA